MNRWWQAIASPPAAPTTVATKTVARRVTINVAAIAARHPAWELAQAIERDRSTPVALTPVAIQALQEAIAPGAFSVPSVDSTLAASVLPAFTDPSAPTGRRGGSGSWTPGTVPGLNLPERRLIADEIQLFQQDVRALQVSALDAFLREVQRRQDAARDEQAALLQQGLQYDIEAAQRSSLSRLVPILPPEDVQLEMTNLRLELLENISSTPARREAARRRLEELEAQWSAQLRRQEAERLTELRRLLVEIPTRVWREGEAQIATYKEAARRRDATFRASVEDAQESRVAQDFSASATRLGIVLPASSLPSQTLAGQMGDEIMGVPVTSGSTTRDGGAARVDLPGSNVPRLNVGNLIGTMPRGPSSFSGSATQSIVTDLSPAIASSAGIGRTSSQIQERRTLLIRALRTLALRDALRWSRMVARRSGWNWPEGGERAGNAQPAQPGPVHEVTQEVLQILKLN